MPELSVLEETGLRFELVKETGMSAGMNWCRRLALAVSCWMRLA